MTAGPLRIAWKDAVARILSHPGAGGVVCVAGPVGSGKSTLARRIIGDAGGALISTDDYLPDYDKTPEHLRDEPGSSRLDALAEDAGRLSRGEPAEVPTWCFHEHRRIGSRLVTPAGLVVIEGIHAMHRTLAGVRGVGVLVDASRETRWARWEAIESSGQRGWGVEKARRYFETVAEPTFERYRPEYESAADFIVTNDRGGRGG